MDRTTQLLNFIVPPLAFIYVCCFVPFFQLVNFLRSVLRYLKPEDVAGKTIIITGAACGIGKQLAFEYARRRANLVLADIRENSLQEVSNKCHQLGASDAITITADVTNIDDCKRIVDSSVSHYGRVDHLVCNAGVASYSMFEDYEDITQLKFIEDVNFWGAVFVTRFAIPYLRKTAGKIIVMSSVESWLPLPGLSLYNASKAAMLAFYETLRLELGSDIHITIVTPAVVETAMSTGEHLNSESRMQFDRHVRKVVYRAIHGKADACAKAIVHGACRGLRYVTWPEWFRSVYLVKLLSLEAVVSLFRLFFVTKVRDPPKTSVSKKLLDVSESKAR